MKKEIWILVLIVVCVWYIGEFQFDKTFEKAMNVKYDDIESIYVEVRNKDIGLEEEIVDDFILLNEEEIEKLINIIQSRKYRRSHTSRYEFIRPIYSFEFFIKLNNDRYIPIDLYSQIEYTIMNARPYKASSIIEEDVLRELYDTIIERKFF